MNTSPRIFTEADACLALTQIAKEKGVERAQLLERMLRQETAHFTSRQYQQTGSAGMEDGAWGKAVAAYFPNGYRTIFFKDNHPVERGTAAPLAFIVWNNVYDFCRFLSDYIDRYNGNYARWNSTSPTRQLTYRQKITAIRPRFNLTQLVRKISDQLPPVKKK